MTPRKRQDKTTASTDAAAAGPTFEQAMAELESIIQRIESGSIGLEQSLAEYEKGVAIIRQCRAVLERAEQRVERLRADGSVESIAGPISARSTPVRTGGGERDAADLLDLDAGEGDEDDDSDQDEDEDTAGQ